MSYLYKFKTDQELVQAITELHTIFVDRQGLSDYVDDKRLVSAYAHFYLPTNQKKMDFLLSQIGQLDVKNLSFIDFGCGPGTYGIRWQERFPEANCVYFDQSNVMLEQAKLFADGKGIFTNQISKLPKEQILFFGNCLNEMEINDVFKLIADLNPVHIFFIEPGTQDFFKKALLLRQAFIESGFNIQYPCPSVAKCPMESFENWCHQTIKVTHDVEVERLAQMAMIDRHTLPMTCHIYTKQKNSQTTERLLRLNKQTKHSLIFDICMDNKFQRIEVSKRGLKKPKLKEILKISYGDNFQKVRELIPEKNIKVLSD